MDVDSARTVPRLKKSLTFLLPDGWKGTVVDLSATGLRIQCILVLDPHLKLDGTLLLPDGQKLALKGEVMWTTPPDHVAYLPAEIGLQLIDPPAEYHAMLARLFAEAE